MSADGVAKAMDRFRQDITDATQRRDDALRKAAKEGMKQVDIVKASGLSRETIRQILNPQIRTQIYDRRRSADSDGAQPADTAVS